MADIQNKITGEREYINPVDTIANPEAGNSHTQHLMDTMKLYGAAAPETGERDTRADIPDSIRDSFEASFQNIHTAMGGHTNGDSIKNMIAAVMLDSLYSVVNAYEKEADYNLDKLNTVIEAISKNDLGQMEPMPKQSLNDIEQMEVIGNKYDSAMNTYQNADTAARQYADLAADMSRAYYNTFGVNHGKEGVYFTKDNIKAYINANTQPVIIFASNKKAQYDSLDKIENTLNGRLAKNPNMILAIAGTDDKASAIAINWATKHNVTVDQHTLRTGVKNDAYPRNDRIINAYGNRIKGVITCGDSGVIANLINKTSERGIAKLDLDANYDHATRPIKPHLVAPVPTQLALADDKQQQVALTDAKTVGQYMYSLMRQRGITETTYAAQCANIAFVHNGNNRQHVFTLSSNQIKDMQVGTMGQDNNLSRLHDRMTHNGTVSAVLPTDKAVLDTTHIASFNKDINDIVQEKQQFADALKALQIDNQDPDKVYIGLPLEKGGQHFVKVSELKDFAVPSEMKYTGNQVTINQYHSDHMAMFDAHKHEQAKSIHEVMGDTQHMHTIASYTQDLLQKGKINFDDVSFIRRETTHMVTDMTGGFDAKGFTTPHYDLNDAVKQVFENQHVQNLQHQQAIQPEQPVSASTDISQQHQLSTANINTFEHYKQGAITAQDYNTVALDKQMFQQYQEGLISEQEYINYTFGDNGHAHPTPTPPAEKSKDDHEIEM